MTGASRRRAPGFALWAVVVLLAATVAAGCGSSGTSSSTQPAAQSSTFSKDTFASIPRYPGSSATGPRSRKAGVTVRSFEVSGATPRQILRWYVSQLDSWELIQPPEATGSTDWRGEWQRNHRRLLVSAAPTPALENEASVATTTQFSLELGDPGVKVSTSGSGESS